MRDYTIDTQQVRSSKSFIYTHVNQKLFVHFTFEEFSLAVDLPYTEIVSIHSLETNN